MSEKFLDKYRVESIRLKNWDYSSPGYYFVTICTKDREFYFGNIKNNKMILSDMGKIAQQYWLQIPAHFPHIMLDEFIIMPNHLHGILKICYLPTCKNGRAGICNECRINNGYFGIDGYFGRDAINRVSTDNIKRINIKKQNNNKPRGGITKKYNPMLNPDSLSSVLRWYKGRTKFEIRKYNKYPYHCFRWQSRFYEKIIRNDNELFRIRRYIKKNPQKWGRDRNNWNCLWM